MFMDVVSSVGVALGLAFIKLRDIHDIHAHMAVIMNEYDINLPHFPGLDFSRVEAEWTRFRGNIPEIWKFNNDGREFQVGDSMKARGLTAVHPVVLIPGIISTVCPTNFRLLHWKFDINILPATESRILVNISRLPTILSREIVGRVQHDVPSNFQ